MDRRVWWATVHGLTKENNLATKITTIVTQREKKKPLAESQKIKRKESKHCTVKSHQITEEDSKKETKEL